MGVSWKGLYDLKESHDVLAQFGHGTASVIACDGIVHGFPQTLDVIDPRVVDGLEESLEFRIVTQPTLHHEALLNL